MTSTKVCLLTGASGTIGYAIAKALKASSNDWHIVLIGRRPPPSSLTHINDKPPPTLPYDTFLKADITNETSVTSALNSHFDSLKNHSDPGVKLLNRLDLLVNCAGTGHGNGPIHDVSADVFREVMEINLVAPYIMSRWAFSKFATSGGGRIINIGSIACESPRVHAISYTTSKYALSGLTRVLSLEGRAVESTGLVAVCQINPGNVRSNIMSAEEMARREREEGFVEAEDVANMVVMVANLPNDVNVLESTMMPTRQPMVGRG